jgi:uncharacterized protein YcbX
VAAVSWLSIAPVKGLALVRPDEVLLERHGVAENRRFFLVDEDGRQFGLLRYGPLVRVRPQYDEAAGRLALVFPDGSRVEDEVRLAEPVATTISRRRVDGRVVDGPWAAPLSDHARRPLRLVQTLRPGDAVDRGRGQVSIVSDASVEELARQSGREEVDARRFRMLVGVGGTGPHEEDTWVGARVRIGEALVLVRGHVGRCAITTQDPETGVPDFDTLRAIKAYRGLRDGELDMGVYGEVLEPGRVRVGDPVAPLE